MVNIEVEESEVFDRLTILEIKMDHLKIRQQFGDKNIDEKIITNLVIQRDKLADIIDKLTYRYFREPELHNLVKELKSINWRIFDLLNKIKIDTSIPAIEVDNLNYQRYLAKKAIQEYLGDNISEIKLGYDQNQ